MAEELKLNNSDELEDWLKGKPAAWSQIIAFRSALRVLPALGDLTNLPQVGAKPNHDENLIIAAFRSNLLSSALHTHQADPIISIAADAAANATEKAGNAVGDVAEAIHAAVDAVTAAGYAAIASASAHDDDVEFAITYAAHTAASAAYAAADATYENDDDYKDDDGVRRLWLSISNDALWLESRKEFPDPKRSALLLARQPLWHGNAPKRLRAEWHHLANSELATRHRFECWIRWYEALSPFDATTPPRDAFGEALTRRIATQSSVWWKRPALEINTDIARWLAEEESVQEPPAEDLPTQLTEALDQLPGQQPAPYQFDWRDGRMEVLPPEALPEDGGIAQDYLDETREKADSLLDHLARSNVDPDIARKVGKLREALTERAADLRPAVVDSRTITVERLLRRLDNPQDAAELSSRILSDLDDLAETARRLCQCLPELWLRDVELLSRGLTGDSAAALLTNLNALRDGIKDAEIIGPDVQTAFDTLSEESAEPADEALKKRRTAMFAVTVRNFLNALLRVAKGSSPVVAGELLRFAKDVGKELRPELVKATAKIVLSGVSITAIAGLFVSLSVPIDGIWRLIPGAETVGRIVEYLKAGNSEAPPPEPSAPPPPPPPRTVRPTSEKGPTRPV